MTPPKKGANGGTAPLANVAGASPAPQGGPCVMTEAAL